MDEPHAQLDTVKGVTTADHMQQSLGESTGGRLALGIHHH